MIQIFSTEISTRLHYVCNVIFNHILRVDFKIVTDIYSLNKQQPVINYSKIEIGNAIQIIPDDILFETGIEDKNVEVEEEYNFFKTSEVLPIKYDLFASSFYLLTRYEEYLTADLDIHRRYKAENSIAFKNDFLGKAVVNRWALKIKDELIKKYPGVEFPELKYEYLPTFDIDSAFAYKNKGIKRLTGGGLRALLKGNFEDVVNRIVCSLGLKKDPFDVFDYIFTLLNKFDLNSIFFFLVGEYGRYDKNIPIENRRFREVIKEVSHKSSIGLHPSYGSSALAGIVKRELSSLSEVVGTNVTKSRQHFLRLKFPDTYRNLIESGIKEDYTMGYASQVGFRAGICTPYPFFDLVRNEKTGLMIYPFQMMDVTLNQYLKLSPGDAINQMIDIYREVKSVKGLLITLWHNESLSETGQWKGWSRVLEKFMELAED